MSTVQLQLKMSEIEVAMVRATPEESATVYEYLVKHYIFHVSSGPPSDWRITEEEVKQNIGSRDDPSKLFEAIHAKDKSSGQVLGQICYYKQFDFYYGKVLEVEQILVDEKYRGHKIGLKLMREVAKVAADNDCLMSWYARNWNAHAIKFYESIGAKKLKEMHSTNGAHHLQFFMFKEEVEALAKCGD